MIAIVEGLLKLVFPSIIINIIFGFDFLLLLDLQKVVAKLPTLAQ